MVKTNLWWYERWHILDCSNLIHAQTTFQKKHEIDYELTKVLVKELLHYLKWNYIYFCFLLLYCEINRDFSRSMPSVSVSTVGEHSKAKCHIICNLKVILATNSEFCILCSKIKIWPMNALESFCPSITLILSIPQRWSNLGTIKCKLSENWDVLCINVSYIDNTWFKSMGGNHWFFFPADVNKFNWMAVIIVIDNQCWFITIYWPGHFMLTLTGFQYKSKTVSHAFHYKLIHYFTLIWSLLID